MVKEVVCPKCSHVRPKDATNPEWQCPACGVCYAKVGADTRKPSKPFVTQPSGNRKFVTTIACFVFFAALGTGFGQWQRSSRWKDVFRSVKPGDIVMYSYEGCEAANKAREHFAKFKMEFTECDTQTDAQCYLKWMRLKTGVVPTIVIHDKHVLKGFSEDALFEALTKEN